MVGQFGAYDTVSKEGILRRTSELIGKVGQTAKHTRPSSADQITHPFIFGKIEKIVNHCQQPFFILRIFSLEILKKIKHMIAFRLAGDAGQMREIESEFPGCFHFGKFCECTAYHIFI